MSVSTGVASPFYILEEHKLPQNLHTNKGMYVHVRQL